MKNNNCSLFIIASYNYINEGFSIKQIGQKYGHAGAIRLLQSSRPLGVLPLWSDFIDHGRGVGV